MMRPAFPCFFLFWCWSIATVGQTDALAGRHVHIQKVYEEENYALTIAAIDLQLKEAVGTTWADSVHLYLYKYARAHRKVNGPDAGAEAGEHILSLVRQRDRAEHELEALFSLSWYYYDIGRMSECVRVDSMAIVVADSDPAMPVAQRGRARQYVAFDHSVIGDHRRSARYALDALAVYGEGDTTLHIHMAESNTAVGAAYWHLGRIREAETYYMRALGILGDRTDLPSLIRKVSTNGNLGVMWQNAGDFARARTYYNESLRLSDRVIAATDDPFTRDEAIVNRSRTYLNMSTVHAQLGAEGRARELLALAWKDRSEVLEPDDPQLLVIKDRMADLELSAGALDKAEELVSNYLASYAAKVGERGEEYIRATSKLGEIARRKGQVQRADSLFRVSIAAGKTNAAPETDASLALTLEHRASLNIGTGRTAEAIADLQQARAIHANLHGARNYKMAQCEVLMAEATLKGGDAKSALAHCDSALDILSDRVQALATSNVPLAFPYPHLLPDAIQWKVRAGRALAGNGGQPTSVNADLDLAIASLARNRSALQDEASKLLLIGAHKTLFDLALEVAYDDYVRTGSVADVDRFLTLSEADRSTLLKGRLNGFAGLRFTGVPDSVISREQELLNALSIHEDDRARTAELYLREREYVAFLQQLEKDHPSYFALRYGERTISLDEMRGKLLTDDRALLVYAMAADHLYIAAVTRRTVRIERVPIAGLDDLVRSLGRSIAERNMAGYLNDAARLYELVLAPVAGDLVTNELLIIPDGPLHAVNFEALLSAPSTAEDFRDNLLLNRWTIAYLLSATTAVQFADLARERTRGVLAIAPGFTDELKRDYMAQVRDTGNIDHHFLSFVRQPFAVRAAEDLGDTWSARVLVGGEASEPGFRTAADDYGILHMGTHAEMNATSPMYSRLVLGKDGDGVAADADGYLHAYEIYELDLRAQLAVLTACETGTGTNDGEGVRSLGYGFAYAGCPSLIISLWNIDEQVSSGIITRFYEHLADGLPKHEALRRAKLEHLSSTSGELSLPYYWAGLVLVGDVSPVEGRDRWGALWPWLLAAAGVFALAMLIRKLRR